MKTDELFTYTGERFTAGEFTDLNLKIGDEVLITYRNIVYGGYVKVPATVLYVDPSGSEITLFIHSIFGSWTKTFGPTDKIIYSMVSVNG